MARIGVLTGGGDCPGLNAVIRAIVRKGINSYEHEFVGFRYGWAGVLGQDAMDLTHETTSGILHRGGTILGTARVHPDKLRAGLDQIKQTLDDNGIDVLIPIGGHFVMDPRDAAYATREMLKPKHAVPIHYGTFPVLKGTPQEYQSLLGQTSTRVHPISPGDKLTF